MALRAGEVLPDERDIDVAVFGATGFTGQYVVKELFEATRLAGSCGSALASTSSGVSSPQSPLRLAAAARNPSKLASTLHSVLGPAAAADVTTVAADVSDEDSLTAVCRRSRVLINCVGPFRFFGEPVVAACISSGCHYVDISGEPEFMERVAAKFADVAQQKGVLVVSACGFDSVPADLGAIFAARCLPPSTTPFSVESFLTIRAPLGAHANFATWESLVHGFASVAALRKLRASLPRQPKPRIAAAPPPRHSWPFRDARLKKWSLPFMGADASVVKRTVAFFASLPSSLTPASAAESSSSFPASKPSSLTVSSRCHLSVGGASEEGRSGSESAPLLAGGGGGGGGPGMADAAPAGSPPLVHYAAYFTVPSAYYAALFVLYGAVVQLLGPYKWGRALLLRFPELFSNGLFSRKGPTRAQLDAASFTMDFFAKGINVLPSSDLSAKDKEVVEIHAQVSGPEVGYVATPIIAVQASLTILDLHGKEHSFPQGGVFTPGSVFYSTNFQKRLQERGISFTKLDSR